jgi:hypothetical protein
MTRDQVEILGKALGNLLTALGTRLEKIEAQLAEMKSVDSDDDYVRRDEIESLIDERVDSYIERNIDFDSMVSDAIENIDVVDIVKDAVNDGRITFVITVQ